MSIKLHNLYKLFTKEDPYIHKTLGFICLANFVYRYYLFFTTNNMNNGKERNCKKKNI